MHKWICILQENMRICEFNNMSFFCLIKCKRNWIWSELVKAQNWVFSFFHKYSIFNNVPWSIFQFFFLVEKRQNWIFILQENMRPYANLITWIMPVQKKAKTIEFVANRLRPKNWLSHFSTTIRFSNLFFYFPRFYLNQFFGSS